MDDLPEHQTVIVEVVLAIQVQSGWPDDCTLGQLRRQAVTSARDTVERMFRGEAHKIDTERTALRSIKVDTIIWRREER